MKADWFDLPGSVREGIRRKMLLNSSEAEYRFMWDLLGARPDWLRGDELKTPVTLVWQVYASEDGESIEAFEAALPPKALTHVKMITEYCSHIVSAHPTRFMIRGPDVFFCLGELRTHKPLNDFVLENSFPWFA